MVGGLVEQQKVRFLGEGARQRRATDFAARKPARRLVGIKLKGREPGAGFPVCSAAGHAVIQKGVAFDDRLLWHIDNPHTGLEESIPAVGADVTGQDAHECRLAGAIASDERRPRPRLEGDIDAFKKLHGSIRETNIAQRRNRRPSGAASGWRRGSPGRWFTQNVTQLHPSGKRPPVRPSWRALEGRTDAVRTCTSRIPPPSLVPSRFRSLS